MRSLFNGVCVAGKLFAAAYAIDHFVVAAGLGAGCRNLVFAHRRAFYVFMTEHRNGL